MKRQVVEDYLELIALTQSYLLANYQLKQQIVAVPEAYSYFKALAAKQMPQKGNPQVSQNGVKEISKPEPVAHVPVVMPKPKSVVLPPQPQPKEASKISMDTPVEKFKLTPPPTSESPDFKEIQKVIRSVAPQLKIIEEVPQAAVIPAFVVEAPFPRSIQENAFVQAVVQAIELQFGSCSVVYLTPQKKSEASQSVKKITLADLNGYMQDPLRKGALWAQILETM